MSFKVGDRVVCIKPTGKLIKDQIYTVINIHDSVFGIGLILKEVGNSDGYLGYHTWRFRKLDYDFVEEVIKQVKPQEVEI